jgi:hypothetical protein
MIRKVNAIDGRDPRRGGLVVLALAAYLDELERAGELTPF